MITTTDLHLDDLVNEIKSTAEQTGLDKYDLLTVYILAQTEYEESIHLHELPIEYQSMYYMRGREIGLSAMRDYAWFGDRLQNIYE